MYEVVLEAIAWMPILAAAGIGLGALKSNRQQQEAQRQSAIEAGKEFYSGFTGRGGNFRGIRGADYLGNMMQGGLAGASFGQQLGDIDFGSSANVNMPDPKLTYAKPQVGINMGDPYQKFGGINSFDYGVAPQVPKISGMNTSGFRYGS